MDSNHPDATFPPPDRPDDAPPVPDWALPSTPPTPATDAWLPPSPSTRAETTSEPVPTAPPAPPIAAPAPVAPPAPAGMPTYPGAQGGVQTTPTGRPAPSFDGPVALEISHLFKAFGAKQAVADLSMNVPVGCMFGFVGPNGAGKTTTISMATGLLRPDAGTIRVWGHNVWDDPPAAKALMGVLPDGMRMFDRLSGAEMLEMSGMLRRMPRETIAERSHALLEALGLTHDADTMVADYSAGMTKKIALACALIHNPRLLLLDEPFESVDPVSGEAIRSILREFVEGGGTVVMSSHVMELVESLCDAVAVIAAGHILAAGPLDDVRGGQPLQQRFLELVGAHDVDRGSLSWLGQSSASS